MKIKKFLCVSLAALTIAGIGAGTNNNTVVNARHRRISRHYRRHHKSLGRWYLHNGHRMYRRCINTSRMFRKGFHDGDSYGAGTIGGTRIHKHYMKSKLYRRGWIIGRVNGGIMGAGFGSRGMLMGQGKNDIKHYNKAIYEYNQGYAYGSHHSNNTIWLHLGNEWSTKRS